MRNLKHQQNQKKRKKDLYLVENTQDQEIKDLEQMIDVKLKKCLPKDKEPVVTPGV